MTHRGPFQPLPFCDSVCDSVISLGAPQPLHFSGGGELASASW